MWSEWKFFSDERLLERLPKTPGIYNIRWMNTDGKPKRISRLLGVDVNSLLYIGKTGKGRGGILAKRLKAFWKATLRGRGHSGGNRFRQFLSERIPRRVLQYRYRPTDNLQQATQLEWEQLEAYVVRYGESPPLNGAMPKLERS